MQKKMKRQTKKVLWFIVYWLLVYKSLWFYGNNIDFCTFRCFIGNDLYYFDSWWNIVETWTFIKQAHVSLTLQKKPFRDFVWKDKTVLLDQHFHLFSKCFQDWNYQMEHIWFSCGNLLNFDMSKNLALWKEFQSSNNGKLVIVNKRDHLCFSSLFHMAKYGLRFYRTFTSDKIKVFQMIVSVFFIT